MCIRDRRPESGIGTPRREADIVEILSGVFNDRTTRAPICLMIRNQDTDSSVYDTIKDLPRPGHSDYTAHMKYGGFNDYRGGGRFSGRLTAALVMAGAVAKRAIAGLGIEILAHTVQIGNVKTSATDISQIRGVYANPFRCADASALKQMLALIEDVRQQGDSIGGVVEGLALNVPVGLGEPLFDTLEGELAKALFAIPAVKGVEFGAGFAVAERRGSQNNDSFGISDNKVVTLSNNAGGVLGGISDGMPLKFRVAVKPTPSIVKPQATVNLTTMQPAQIEIKGRHDTCIVPRAVIVVEAVTALVLCDLALRAGILSRILK